MVISLYSSNLTNMEVIMLNIFFSLKDVLDIDRWQSLQDSLAFATRMAIITIDYKGAPVTHHSNCSSFCTRVRSDPSLIELCHKCDARGGLEAVRSDGPYVYYCHFGIIDIAIPIIIENKYLGAIMAGQVRLPKSKNSPKLEYVFNPRNQDLIKNTLSIYNKEYHHIPVLSLEKINHVVEMLNQLAHYIISEAIDKQLKLDACTALIYGNPAPQNSPSSQQVEVQSLTHIQKEISNSLLDVLIIDSERKKNLNLNASLNKAIDYIHEHKGIIISLEEIAKVCYLSSSYFSRLFKKEIGMNYNIYITKLKMMWAKELFDATNMSVNQVSDALGYNDAGYFIKKFKVAFGITPGIYKKK